jgi:predicted nucleotidyltransferase component of viral defense system
MQSPFFKNAVRPADLEVLEELSRIVDPSFYLAGGTALSLHLGHRYSYDLDFFSPQPFRNDLLRREAEALGIFEVFTDSRGTLEGRIRQTRVTFLEYRYPMTEPPTNLGSAKVASIRDIAAMKLSALSSRGSRKDFVDLFFIKDFMDWPEILRVFRAKFAGSGYDLVHVVKSLAWFEEAEKEPMPVMLKARSWEDVKAYFSELQGILARGLREGEGEMDRGRRGGAGG